MTPANFSTSQEAQQAVALLKGYRFELGNHEAAQWVSLWMEDFRPAWIRDAIVESLYQGRYKSRSVKQILDLWQRRGQPIRHASHEFEASICREFGSVKLSPMPETAALPARTQRAPSLRRASQRTHRSLTSISFNLAEQTSTTASARNNASNVSRVGVTTSSSTSPAQTAATLRDQKQSNGILFPSARAIQPFKPALPFSAQTLRLAKQKALAGSD